MNWLLKQEHLPRITVDHHRKQFGFPVKDYYAKLGFDTSEQSFPDLCRRFNTRFHSGVRSCTLRSGARVVLDALRAAGKWQSVLSATKQSTLEETIRGFDIEHYFDHIYGIGDDEAGGKVDRGRELIIASGISPKLTILLGDTDHDLEVGNALGIEVILVDHGHQHGDRLRLLHNKVITWA
jgi:phosphoglycolate phosphatase